MCDYCQCKWGVGSKENDPSFRTVSVGENSKEEWEVFHGEYPHLRQDNTFYARRNGVVADFDGNQMLFDISFKEYNYLRNNRRGLRILASGECRISVNGNGVYMFHFGDLSLAMARAQEIIVRLREFPVALFLKKELDALPGRKLWYRDEPAIIESRSDYDYCLILKPDGMQRFKRPPCFKEEPSYDDERDYAKVDILDPYIYWFRD